MCSRRAATSASGRVGLRCGVGSRESLGRQRHVRPGRGHLGFQSNRPLSEVQEQQVFASLVGRWTVDGGLTGGPRRNLASAPAAVSQRFARLHIFSRGGNNQLLHEWWSGGERNPWGDPADIQTTEPIAFSCGRSEPTRVELVRREGPRPTPFDVILQHGQVGGPGALGQTERHSVQAALLLEVACDEGQRLRAATDVQDRSVGVATRDMSLIL